MTKGFQVAIYLITSFSSLIKADALWNGSCGRARNGICVFVLSRVRLQIHTIFLQNYKQKVNESKIFLKYCL